MTNIAMNIAQIPQRLEIAFWMKFISLMHESPSVAFTVRETYMIIEKLRNIPFQFWLLIWAVTGLFLGFLLGYLAIAIG
jgi:hypothetical protein